MLVDQLVEILAVVGVGLGERLAVLLVTGGLDDLLVVLRQAGEPALVGAEGELCARLVHARPVVVLRGLVELEEVVVERADPLRGVDRAGDEVFVDLATGKRNGRRAQLGQDLSALARDTHLEALEVLGRVDLLVEPAAHLDARIAGRHRLDAEAVAEFVPQLLAAAILAPCVDLGRRQAERNSRKGGPAGVLADPVIVGADIGLGVARCDFVEGVERTDALAGGEVLHVDAAVGQFADTRREALGGKAEARKVPRPGRDDYQIGRRLRDGRGGERRGGGSACACQAGFLDE